MSCHGVVALEGILWLTSVVKGGGRPSFLTLEQKGCGEISYCSCSLRGRVHV
jgi:hypothetical protein